MLELRIFHKLSVQNLIRYILKFLTILGSGQFSIMIHDQSGVYKTEVIILLRHYNIT